MSTIFFDAGERPKRRKRNAEIDARTGRDNTPGGRLRASDLSGPFDGRCPYQAPVLRLWLRSRFHFITFGAALEFLDAAFVSRSSVGGLEGFSGASPSPRKPARFHA
jgi:hypothetical protein